MNNSNNNDKEFRIIVIDDNPEIHQDFIKILSPSNPIVFLDELQNKMFGKKKSEEKNLLPTFKIDSASQGKEGLEYVKKAVEENNPYALAFIDIRMPPGWDGIETVKQIWQVDKDIQVVICTAYSDYSWEETVGHLGKTDNLLILKKPFDNVSVRQLACALTKKWLLSQEMRKINSSLKQEVNNQTISLQKSLSMIKATLESSDEGIIVISNEGAVVNYNQKFCILWDISKDIMDSKKEKNIIHEMLSQIENYQTFNDWLLSLHSTAETGSLDIIKLKNGKIFDCYSQPQKINNKIVGRVLNFRDVTERNKLEQELQYQAKHDPLTGLPNRNLLLEKIRNAIKDSEKKNTFFAVLFLDLDRFKLINDSLSHAAGDELLRLASERLKSTIRSDDTLARLGGDEFVIILTNMKSNKDVIIKANAILQLFQTPFTISNRKVTVTASIGISVYPKDGKSSDTLLRNSDAAMYSVKETGSNHFQFYTEEMNEKSLERLENEMQLRQALKNNELFLCYQPQFDLNSEKLIAVEALLRWDHPKKGILLPMDFIPLAEETGLIIPIGEWVLKTACMQNKKWQERGYPPIRIAINLSIQQLKQQNIVDSIKMILEDIQLKAEYLEIELTENEMISSIEVMNTVAELKKLGITIAIDDFGTGYSSLSYLKKLPLDRLKIDSSFIKQIKSEEDDEVIIRAIIAVAKNLNLEVLAEGVETQHQLNFLKKQQCDEIQGFYYSKPLSANEFEEMLKGSKSHVQ